MRAALALLLAVLPALPAGAQDLQREPERPAQGASAADEAGQASSEAQARRPVEGAGDVTYDDVLKHPDDVELNYRWAKKQIDAGDVKGASATLERILMVRPDLTAVRLTYAVVLFRLDSLAESKLELERVAEHSSGALLAEARDYLRRVSDRQRLTHVQGLLGYGFEYDDNRNAGPASGQSLFNGVAYNLSSGKAAADTSQLFLAQAGLRRDLQGEAARAVYGKLTYYRAQQTSLNTLDLQAYSFEGGLELRAGRWTLTPALLADHIRLDEQTYLRTRGARLRL
ncbi:MAG: hypothetical protein KGL53_04900, partial [Elusimicrobia bacterium]|nr:hypothetical protein [Elusimicrobiota bacterium]